MFRLFITAMVCATMFIACGAGKTGAADQSSDPGTGPVVAQTSFSADSAYSYTAGQVSFGPRVPGSKAHSECGDWLARKLKATGAEVSEQKTTLTTFDGVKIPMRNIIARLNPESDNRILLLAHWDSRPWADRDPDASNHQTPIAGANDGASGVGVLLELARVIGADSIATGVDILLCDAEDWGTEDNDESWAMGARYFAGNPPESGYMPKAAILLDMVGAPDATFMREYFSQQADPALADEIWAIGHSLGYGDMFINRIGSAVNDDHVELIKAGIPAIDIIDYREGQGFFPGWHTTSDNIDAISASTLGAVGKVLETYIRRQ